RSAPDTVTAAYTVSGALRAYATSMRVAPGNAGALFQVTPPSVGYIATPSARPATQRLESNGWQSPSSALAVVRRDHVAPPSELRQIPEIVEASRTVGSFGSMAILLTEVHSGPEVAGSCVQLMPPSVDLNTPAPKFTALFDEPSGVTKKHCSPVPAYSTSGWLGCIAMQLTASTAGKSGSIVHDVPPFVVFHTPPLTEPIHITDGSFG